MILMQRIRRSEILILTHRAAGFTLLELVVVIAVMAILATVAVRSLNGVEDQARFDSTQRGLSNVQSAIDGDRGLRQPDGSMVPNGFVADMGRLPNLFFGTDPAAELQELWTQPVGVSAYAIRSAPSPDSDLKMGSGWHGPYLQMPFGQARLLDGWGNPYSLIPSGSSSTAPVPIQSIQSLGSDNAPGATSADTYAADLPASPLLFLASDYSATVTCNVVGASSSTPPASAKLFEPDGTGKVTSAPATAVISGSTIGFTFSNVSPGSRIIRVYADSAGLVPLATQYIVVPKGGLANVVISLAATTQPTSTTQPSN